MTLAAGDDRRDLFAAERRLDHRPEIARIDARFREPFAVRDDFQIALAPNRIGDDIRPPRHFAEHGGNLFRGRDHLIEIVAEHAHADLRVHAGGQHVHSVLNRPSPDVRPTGHLQRAIQFTAEAGEFIPLARPQKRPASEALGLLRDDRVKFRQRINHRQRRQLAAGVMMLGRLLGFRSIRFSRIVRRRDNDRSACRCNLIEPDIDTRIDVIRAAQ